MGLVFPMRSGTRSCNRFFATKSGTQGTGLGPSITHDVVKAHRGEITIGTNGSDGATFTIGLPAQAPG